MSAIWDAFPANQYPEQKASCANFSPTSAPKERAHWRHQKWGKLDFVRSLATTNQQEPIFIKRDKIKWAFGDAGSRLPKLKYICFENAINNSIF